MTEAPTAVRAAAPPADVFALHGPLFLDPVRSDPVPPDGERPGPGGPELTAR
ncbi:hypothetical protein ACIQBJ_12080 [Kitasatospora sp. NPDC088391]|uniref:hypothetical protein n=1 Tax=Kitasatospora sp. NPDC088391 TaxID=3364074 RepID=UPI0037F6006A